MKISYYPGCTLNTYAKGFDTSARESSVLLGFELKELDKWNCCGATFPLTPDNIMGLLGPTSVLNNARQEGDTLTTLCSVCYNVLKRTNKVISDNTETRNIINDHIDSDYSGDLNVIHYLEVLKDKIGFDKVAAAVKRPLKGIKAGAYYGCALLRPADVGIDNAESPAIFEDFLKAIGCTPVDFPNKIECCGAHLAMNNEGIVTKLSGNIISSAKDRGAEIIVSACPLCQYNLEGSQQRLAADGSLNKEIPVLYFTQLLGLALGQDENTLGLENMLCDIRPLLKEKGV